MANKNIAVETASIDYKLNNCDLDIYFTVGLFSHIPVITTKTLKVKRSRIRNIDIFPRYFAYAVPFFASISSAI